MKKTLFLLSAFLIFSNSYSEDYTLEKAIDKAISDNKTIKQYEMDLSEASLDLNMSRKDLFPRFDLTAQTFRSKSSTYDVDLTSTSPLSEKDIIENSYSYVFSISQPVFKGGKLINAMKKKTLLKEIKEVSKNFSIENIRFEITKKYMGILKAKNNKEIYTNSLNDLNESYQILNQRFTHGLVAKTALLQMMQKIKSVESDIK